MPAMSWATPSIDPVGVALTYLKNFSNWRLSSFFLQGTVCGLCGNFDDQTKNDFTTRDHMVVTSELDFGNSWKEASTCPDVTHTPDPCSLNPHRRSWAEKQCSIIKSGVFKGCHSKVGWLQAWEGPKGEQGHRYGWTLGMCKQVWAGAQMCADCGHGQRAESHCKCVVVVVTAMVGATERDW